MRALVSGASWQPCTVYFIDFFALLLNNALSLGIQSIEIRFCLLKTIRMNKLLRGRRNAKSYIIALVFSLLTTPGASSLERSHLLRRSAPQEHESHSGWAERHAVYFGADYNSV